MIMTVPTPCSRKSDTLCSPKKHLTYLQRMGAVLTRGSATVMGGNRFDWTSW